MTKLFLVFLLANGLSFQPYDDYASMEACLASSKELHLEAQQLGVRIESSCVREKDLRFFLADIQSLVDERQANEKLWGY